MGKEHGQYWTNDYPDNINQPQVLPAVIDDEDAHHGDRGMAAIANGKIVVNDVMSDPDMMQVLGPLLEPPSD
jgi:hypothetical protein